MRLSDRIKSLLLSVVFGLLFLVSPGTALGAGRVVAIGDIHGAYPQLVTMLKRTGLVDDALRWSGGDTTLVQVGDMLDRGAQPREVMDLLMRLQQEASAAGGRVIVLLGNHEAMNIVGDLRYVTPTDYAEFADHESPHRRKRAWKQWRHLLIQMARRQGWKLPSFGSDAHEKFNEAHPPGYFAYREAMSPKGVYGKWLRTLPAAARVGDTIFVHGGLSPGLSVRGVEDLNKAVASEIEDFDRDTARLEELGVSVSFADLPEFLGLLHRELQGLASRGRTTVSSRYNVLNAIQGRWGDLGKTLIMGGDGPLWFRGFANWTPEEGVAKVDTLCREWNASRFVVGHSPTGSAGHIVSRFDGRIMLIDTGMLPGHYPGGRPSALELTAQGATAVYPQGESAPAAWEGEVSSRRPLVIGRYGGAAVPAVGLSSWMGAGTSDPVPEGSAVEPGQEPESGRIWIGPDGKRLPFHSGDEIVDFLRTADIIATKRIYVGINTTIKMTLKKDGIVARAAFRTVHEEKLRKTLPTGTVLNFKDSYKSEVSAYELSRLLGIDNVPPATLRRWNNEDGSIQLWIEQTQMEIQRLKAKKPLPNAKVWLQLFDMHVFDNVIGNQDRNQGNILYDRLGRLWLIDHTRSFSRSPLLPDAGNLTRCSIRLWDALHRLDMAQLKAHLSDSLYKAEMKAVLKRRDGVVRILQKKIDEKGRDAVLFDMNKALGTIDVLPSEPATSAPPPDENGGT
jgi:hypothetical protein